jgi:hypothetical protein
MAMRFEASQKAADFSIEFGGSFAFSSTRTALVVGSSGASRVLYPPADLVVTVSFQSLAETNRSTSAAIKSGIPGCIQ